MKGVRFRQLLAFLRFHRHKLFYDAFQDEPAKLCEVHVKDRVPHPPAFLEQPSRAEQSQRQVARVRLLQSPSSITATRRLTRA